MSFTYRCTVYISLCTVKSRCTVYMFSRGTMEVLYSICIQCVLSGKWIIIYTRWSRDVLCYLCLLHVPVTKTHEYYFVRVQWMTTWRCFCSLAMSSSSLPHFLWLLSGLWSTMWQRFGLMPLRWSTSSRDLLLSQLLILGPGRSVKIIYVQKYYKLKCTINQKFYQLKCLIKKKHDH